MMMPVYQPENTSVLVIAGLPGTGKSTLIEGLYHFMHRTVSPTLWVDTTLDGGVLRKLKGEQFTAATGSSSLYESLCSLRLNTDFETQAIDWQLAETPYFIDGAHEGLALYPNTFDTSLIKEANALLQDPLIKQAMAFGWPRLIKKNYRYVILNAHNLSVLQFMLPTIPTDLLVLTTPEASDDTFLLELMEKQGHWHSRNILMTQTKPNQGLPNAWNQWLETHPHWQFLGRLPWFERNTALHEEYLDSLYNSLSRMNWEGMHAMRLPPPPSL
jgi:GTPase SAR1 family protein